MALTDNIVSYWKLDESSGNAADSVGSNTLTNSNVTYSSGKINNGAVFNSTSDSLQAPSSIISTGSDFTITAWVYRNNSSDVQEFIFDQRRQNDGYPMLSYNIYQNKQHIQLRDSNLSNYVDLESTNTISATTWTFVAVTMSGTTLTLYKNASSDGSTTSEAIYNNCDCAYVGQTFCVTNNFDGMLDEVGIWSRALSGTEISSIYNGGSGIQYPFVASGPANLKSYNTNLKANIKTINTNPIANVKSINTNT